MSKEKKTLVGAINITMQPHSPEKYLSLFKEANSLRMPVQIRGDTYGILSGSRQLGNASKDSMSITGDVFRFTNIDKNANWFNTVTFDFADDDELGQVKLPENLKPNSSRFSYIFDSETHYLFYEGYFDGKTLSPNSAQKFFEGLLNHPELVERYGVVEVNHIPKADALDAAMSLPHKRRIEYVTTVPNPDDLLTTEQEVMRRMNEQNVQEKLEVYTAKPGKSVELDEELRVKALIAAKNGSVVIVGKDENLKPAEFSTKKHPYTETDYFDPEIETAFSTMQRVSSRMKDKIDAWFRV